MSRHSAKGPAWEAQRQRVLDRDGWQCAYCGKDLVGDDATVDHLEAIAASGRDGDSYTGIDRSPTKRKPDNRQEISQ